MRFPLAILALFAAPPCLAQTETAQPNPATARPLGAGSEGWSITLGMAPILTPMWQGSRDMALSIFPDVRVAYKDRIFASIPEGIGWNAVNQSGWKAGPIAKARFGRDEERGGSPFLIAGKSDGLRGLGNIGVTAELGGFVERQFGSWRGRVELRRGFGGHEGVVADTSLTYRARVGRAIVSVGPRATVASKDVINTFFGIDAVQSRRSGLPVYTGSGGLQSYGVGAVVLRPINRRSALTLFTGVDRLGDPASDSPLVRERGRAMQFTLGLGYGYRFRL